MARRTGFSVGLRETLYNLTMRRNSVYVTFLVIGGFAATKFMGVASDYVWETYNKGKLFKDLEKSLAAKEE
ncbi:hypothetical protein GAYE_SCF22MG4190 [Galdieria yellowstonensis]|jgi:hypothetical protein|uniref:Complex III subunit 9 n=1 Tax=Galdieria yellowstonensis TaxID=3028027 RepID=A0AAV9IGC2_9RHOD|nr:hypothetical protein GAYE_SCF22MG4190 [Galdieria yellowstonensis]